MKKQMKTIKRLACLLLLCTVVLTFASCASSTPNADDASGSLGANINWTYTKDGKTLTLIGSGAMDNITVSDDSDAPWAEARLSAEKIVISEGITAIGTYAFWGMNNVKEVTLPSSVTEIRDFAFAFCGNLTSISIPGSLTLIGKSAFEGCGALTSIYLPASVTSVGDRAFAYCYSLKSAIITAAPAVTDAKFIGACAFENCRSLESLVFRSSVTAAQIADDAFRGASRNFENAEKTENPTGASNVVIRYMKDGMEMKTDRVELAYGESRTFTPETIEGYTPDRLSITVVGDGADHDYTVTYNKNEAVTETPADTDAVTEEAPDEGVSASTIVAIVIMGVVLVAIAVGAFFLVRSDKKAAKNGTTVRKNDPKSKQNQKNKKK